MSAAIGIAISRSNPRVLVAFVEHGFQPRATIVEGGVTKDNPEYKDMTKLGTGIYRSEDGGASWKYLNRMNNRPFYYSHVFINPLDDKLVYFLTSSLNYLRGRRQDVQARSADCIPTSTRCGSIRPTRIDFTSARTAARP